MSWIDRIDQIRVLASPVRQEILDTVQAMGPCAIAEVARELHRIPESLYYHVGRLTEVGLLEEVGRRATDGRPEVLYEVPPEEPWIRYDPGDPENVDAVTAVARSMLRVAERDFRAGFTPDLAVTSGPERNLWAARTKAWVRHEDVIEVNRLLARLSDLLSGGRASDGDRLLVLTWIMAPVATASG